VWALRDLSVASDTKLPWKMPPWFIMSTLCDVAMAATSSRQPRAGRPAAARAKLVASKKRFTASAGLADDGPAGGVGVRTGAGGVGAGGGVVIGGAVVGEVGGGQRDPSQEMQMAWAGA